MRKLRYAWARWLSHDARKDVRPPIAAPAKAARAVTTDVSMHTPFGSHHRIERGG